MGTKGIGDKWTKEANVKGQMSNHKCPIYECTTINGTSGQS